MHDLKAKKKRELSALNKRQNGVAGRGKCQVCGGVWDADGRRGEISCY